MTALTTRLTAPAVRRPAFTIVESLISTILVGGLLVAALNTVGASMNGRKMSGDRGLADLMAQDLMAEILTKPYEDPDGSPVFGAEAGEGTATRTAFDDVDDYDGWSSSPEYKDGTVWPSRSDWTRVVKVEYVDVGDLKTVLLSDQGAKCITVVVRHNGQPLVTLTAVRTAAADVASQGLVP